MSLQNTESETVPQKSNGWLRRASKAFARLARSAPPTPARAEPAPAAPGPVVGVRKPAVCKDARGQFRTIDLFLPADLVRELSRPLDIRFLDGDEPVTADQLGKAIRSNFVKVGGSV